MARKARIKPSSAEKAKQKLLALLSQEAPELVEIDKAQKARQGNLYEIPEEEIQEFREAQGILYFLRAPALFQYRICSHCGAEYMVSRMFVGNCSYTCIRLELEKLGIKWTKGHDLEALAMDPQVYNGQEPIWIRNLPNLRRALELLHSTALESSDGESSSPTPSPEAKNGTAGLITL